MLSAEERIKMLTKDHQLSVRKQADLLGVFRSNLYYKPVEISAANHEVMRQIDEIYTAQPFYGYRRIGHVLRQNNLLVNDKKVRRLMRQMGLVAIYPKPNTSLANAAHVKYPYLLKNLDITRPNQVWATDITYIRMPHGFLYLVAVIDWYSRYIVSWELSNTMEVEFCNDTLNNALKLTKPEIFNSDQGAQFTSNSFTNILKKHDIKISMNGKGRCVDNMIIERFWRSVKYEEVYLKDYNSVTIAQQNIADYIHFYNHVRPHQALEYDTPECRYNETEGGGANMLQ